MTYCPDPDGLETSTVISNWGQNYSTYQDTIRWGYTNQIQQDCTIAKQCCFHFYPLDRAPSYLYLKKQSSAKHKSLSRSIWNSWMEEGIEWPSSHFPRPSFLNHHTCPLSLSLCCLTFPCILTSFLLSYCSSSHTLPFPVSMFHITLLIIAQHSTASSSSTVIAPPWTICFNPFSLTLPIYPCSLIPGSHDSPGIFHSSL